MNHLKLSVVTLLLTAGALRANGFDAEPARGSLVADKPGTAGEIATMRAAYDVALQGVGADKEKWAGAMEAWYLGSLDKVLADRAKAGDLDGALAVKAEKERLTTHTETTEAQLKSLPPALGTVRATYDSTRRKAADEVAKRTAAAGLKFMTDLEGLQKRLTMKGEIDEALSVKAERERFLKPPEPAVVASNTPAAPAAPAAPVVAETKPDVPAKAGTPPELLGRWRLTNTANGWSGTRTFKEDGTFVTETGADGKWELDQEKVVMNYGKSKDEMLLPLDPKGTKVKISRGRIIGAVKEAP